MKLVPMTEADFNKKRNRRILIGVGAGLLMLAIVGTVMWRSSAPASARNDSEDGTRLFNSGKYPEAAVALTRSIEAGTNLAESYQIRARVYRILNDPKKAVADFTKAIELKPDELELYRLRALSYRDITEFENAVRDYDHIIRVKPTADTYSGRGVCYRDLGKPDLALADFSRAVELDPSLDNYMHRGMANAATGDHRAAIADFDKAIALRPEMPYSYRSRAFSREAVGDKSGAQADRTRARSIEYPRADSEAQKR